MKNQILPFITMLLLLSINNTQAQNSKTTQTSKTFFQVRDEIRRQIEKEKEEGSYNEEEREQDDAMAKFKRWEHFMLPRVGPTGTFFDADAVYKSYKNYYSIHDQNKTVSSNSWEAIGPFTDISDASQILKVGVGRMNCIAQHPLDSNILFIGTMGGGIWKTIDAGGTWVCLDQNLPSMSISDIAINPVHPDTMYAATGDAVGNYYVASIPDFHQGHYSCGIIMSIDGGTTWTQSGFTYQQMQTENIYRLVIDPVITNNLMVGCDKGLYRSIDAGATWTQMDTTIIYDLQINPLDASKYYAVADSGRKLERSYDGGATFAITNAVGFAGGAGLTRVRVSAADTNKIYVVRGTGFLYRSTNGGQSFTIVKNFGILFGHQYDYDKALALSPVDTNVMLIGLVPLIKSINKGATFAIIDSMDSYNNGLHVDFHELEFSIFNSNNLYAINDGGVYVSHDIGETWTSLNHGLNVTQYYKMSSSYLNPDLILAGAQDNSNHLFDGVNWTLVTGADGLDCSFDKGDENTAYASIQNGFLYRSSDGGHTFPNLITPAGFIGDWEAPHLANPLNTNKLFFAGDRVYASENKGDSWQVISPVLDTNFVITSIAQSPADTSTLYAASYRNIFVTHDNGVNWSTITPGLPADSVSITDVKTADNNSNTVYVTFSGFHNGEKIYKTMDGGLTWTNISGSLPNVPFNTIIAQNNFNNDLYAGCDFGVFFKNDTMNDWVSFNTNLPGVIIADLNLNYRNGKLYTATHGRGIYSIDLVSPVTPVTNDAAIAKIISPVVKDYCDSLTTPFAVNIKNYASDTLYNVTVNYSIDNGTIQSIIWTGALAPFQFITDTLAMITLYGGNHHLNTFTSNPNSSTDMNPLNDSKSQNITVGTAIAAFPFAEGFESGTFPPVDWLRSTGSLWYADTIGAYNASAHSAVANFYNVNSGTDFLSTMRIDLTNATPTPFLSFVHAYAMYSAQYLDTLMITATNDCGGNWDTLFSKSAQDLTTVLNFVTNPYYPAASEWVTTYIDLSAYIGQKIKVRFEAHSGYGNLLYLDDINLIHGTVSIAENKKDNINVFPNPTNGKIYISDPDNSITNVQVFDQHGKMIYNNSSKQIHQSIDMSAYQQSLYFIKMQTVNGMVTKKISLVK